MASEDSRQHILIVEDDEAIATGLALNLRISGYEPTVVGDGESAIAEVDSGRFALMILDINLPKRDGIAILGELRRRNNHLPVVVLSARNSEYDKVAALRLGADDYVTKPFALAEFLARIHAVLRRTGAAQPEPPPVPAATDTQRFGDAEVNLETRTVLRDGAEIKLTHLEFELLAFFLGHPQRVFSREELMRSVWGQRSGSHRTIDNFVGQLRGKLELDAENPKHFITVRGSGYRFDP